MLFGKKKAKLIIKNPPTRSNFYPPTMLKGINRKAKSYGKNHVHQDS